MSSITKITLFLLFLSSAGRVWGQTPVTLEKGDTTIGFNVRGGESYTKVIGNVRFVQNNTIIDCDTATLYKASNRIEAFGHIHIQEGDSVDITAGSLFYEGDKRLARLRDDVVFTKLDRVTLYTDYLDYYRNLQEARYFNGGRVVDSTNVLTSEKGYYQTNTNMASFKKNVVGKNPDYTLESDTLQYNTRSNIVYFRAPTKLTNVDGTVFNLDRGEYDTRIKSSDLRLGEVETRSYVITGQTMRSDERNKYYTATGEVVMIGKENNIIINGDHGIYDKKKGIAKVYGHALMKKILENDTLFLSADTLMALENDQPDKERLLAYHKVRIYKTDLQGRADSLAYFNADSILYFYDDPVLWTGGNQMTADSINMVIRNNTIDHLNMVLNSFVVSEDSLSNYNQIKGRDMIAFFNAGNIHHVDVDGNAESVFYALDDTNSFLMGLNKSICSTMRINFRLNQADNISFYQQPEARFIPPQELTPEDKKLAGFSWRIKEKPTREEVLYLETKSAGDSAGEKEKADLPEPVQKEPQHRPRRN